MKRLFLYLLGGLLILVVAFGSWVMLRGDTTISTVDNSSVDSLKQLPDVTLTNFDGDEVLLSSYLGTPMLVNVWATWCPFCVDELADFAEIQEEFGDAVVVVAVDRAESRGVAQEFVREMGLSDKLIFLLDVKDEVYTQVGGFSMPETLFVDAKGTIVTHRRGFMTQDEMRMRVKQLIN